MDRIKPQLFRHLGDGEAGAQQFKRLLEPHLLVILVDGHPHAGGKDLGSVGVVVADVVGDVGQRPDIVKMVVDVVDDIVHRLLVVEQVPLNGLNRMFRAKGAQGVYQDLLDA